VSSRSQQYLTGLVRELRGLPAETEWVEFKANNADGQAIGEYISALANTAALMGKASGYLVWGIDDETHDVVGTSFRPRTERRGNEELESWLLRLLNPKADFRFHEITLDETRVVILEIERATRQPVQFQGVEYIRVGSYKKKLKEFPERERNLWRIFDRVPFEEIPAMQEVDDHIVLELLDYPSYFDLMGHRLPEGRTGVLAALERERLIARNDAGSWSITSLGAVLFAKTLDSFPKLARKVPRVIEYDGNSRVSSARERSFVRGYACAFEDMIGHLGGIIPHNEVINRALRRDVPMYPEIAIRELMANALIHQDFFIGGSGPMVEVFTDRIEITNPGAPLVEAERFLDTPPRSRNEALASMMRRVGICEERGSGIDKVVFQTELYQLPAPIFEVTNDSTRSVLFAHQPLTKMDKGDRIRACYLHACLKFVNREFMTNRSLRERFGIETKNSATASRLIKEALEAGVIVPHDASAAPKLMKYVPRWAVEEQVSGDFT
jgi:ATP-dependent DNA helicase RecG